MMRRSRRYAGGSPSATSRNFSEFCISPSVTSGTSIEGDRIRSARHRILTTRQPSGFVFRGGRWARKSLGKSVQQQSQRVYENMAFLAFDLLANVWFNSNKFASASSSENVGWPAVLVALMKKRGLPA